MVDVFLCVCMGDDYPDILYMYVLIEPAGSRLANRLGFPHRQFVRGMDTKIELVSTAGARRRRKDERRRHKNSEKERHKKKYTFEMDV